MKMTSNRPYMIRAIYDWVVDNNLSPCIMVDCNYPGIVIPKEQVNDDSMIFNISPIATQDLKITNSEISFMARFGAKAHHIFVPISSILAIYAQENGQGMVFDPESTVEEQTEDQEKKHKLKSIEGYKKNGQAKKNTTGKPDLKVLK